MKIEDLIAQGEHQQQDFKYKVTDAVKLARSVSAFANTDGGRLLIGVRDDGTIHGVRSEEEIFMMHAAACKYCTPEPTIQFETLHVPTEPHGGRLRTVVVCTISPSAQRPVFALEDGRKTAYIRVADENIVASPVHLAIWRQEARLQGEAYADSPAEHLLLTALAQHPEGLPLNPLLKAALSPHPSAPSPHPSSLNPHPPTSALNPHPSTSSLPRPLIITLLARFIRFGLARIQRRDQSWIFLPQETE